MLGGKCRGRTEGRIKKVSESVTESERTMELTDPSLSLADASSLITPVEERSQKQQASETMDNRKRRKQAERASEFEKQRDGC